MADRLPRLNIPVPGMFAPGQQAFLPAINISTPLQPMFNPQTPTAPHRPTSMNLQNPLVTPLAGHFPRGPPPNRNRRQLSIGGPPKAVLGGPARKISPLPAAALAAAAGSNPTAPPARTKKVTVKIPKETVDGTRPEWARNVIDNPADYFDYPVVLPVAATIEEYPTIEWRHHLPPTVDVFLPGKRAWDVIKHQEIEQKLERLGVERGSGSSSVAPPHIHARAASISSPADPALLLFKLNKLQQSQQAQSSPFAVGSASSASSMATSPQPPFLSPSPHSLSAVHQHQQAQARALFINNVPSSIQSARLPGHSHSFSLAHPVSAGPYRHSFSPLHSGSPNPFGFTATLGNDNPQSAGLSLPPSASMRRSPIRSPLSVITTNEPLEVHAPQGRVPVSVPNLSSSGAALSAVARTDSRPDFVRGFGLDIPEESEEELEAEAAEEREYVDTQRHPGEIDAESELDDEDKENSFMDGSGVNTVHHSRHESRLSASLSLRSFAGLVADGLKERVEILSQENSPAEERRNPVTDPDAEAVEEWTGSEDHLDDDDSESIGEWSNPSDEERARHFRLLKRRRRALSESQSNVLDTSVETEREIPRRLPNFPRPPDNTTVFSRPLPRRSEDDFISNPSEEEDSNHGYSRRGSTSLSVDTYHRHMPSAPHSAHDPSHAHSRRPSEVLSPTGTATHSHQPSVSMPTATRLNPNAKPFVFGAPAPLAPGSAPLLGMGHARLPSLGKPLNVEAKEFKPGNFTFRVPMPGSAGAGSIGTAPPGPMPVPAPGFPVPNLTMPPEASANISRSGAAGHRPLPLPPASAPLFTYEGQSSPFATQGREKRRRESSSDFEDDEGEEEEEEEHEGNNSMASFKFPSPQKPVQLNTQAEPFTFPALREQKPYVESDTLLAQAGNSTRLDVDEEEDEEPFSFPSSSTITKAKRAPIPLDFKHPVSSNTVPAGVFKALASSQLNSADERTRRTVRSRLSTHDPFDHAQMGHSSRPSLDDSNVAGISLARKVSRNRPRMVTDPGSRQLSVDPEDVFGGASVDTAHGGHVRRRSSLPENIGRETGSDMSEDSIRYPARELVTRIEMQQVESSLEKLLDEKLATLNQGRASLSGETEEMISEVIQLFRSQLQDSAAKSFEESQMDARGELDFELIKDIVIQGHQESLDILRRELADLIPRLSHARALSPAGISQDVHSLEVHGARILDAILELNARVANMRVPQTDNDLLLNDLMSALSPILNSLHHEAIDYDVVTEQLAQAVKPHITQLIDLASDKRETAELIVNKLAPLLPALGSPSPQLDTDALVRQITTEVRRAIAPIDAFEIKEQVADLVVERLDSRLTVRDNSFNVKVTDNVGQLVQPIETVRSSLAALLEEQQTLASQQSDLSSTQRQVADAVAELPRTVVSAIENLKPAEATAPQPDENILHIKTTVNGLVQNLQSLSEQSSELSTSQKDILRNLSVLPDSFANATNVLQGAHAEFVLTRDAYKRELDDLRKSNTDAQVQLAKARGAHGQVRVEKDMLSDKLSVVEADRDRLREQVKALNEAAAKKALESPTAESRATELQDGLNKALARLQASDVTAQANQERIAELEKLNRDLVSEKQVLKSRVDTLDLQTKFAQRDREAAEKAVTSLQKQYDQLLSQQSQWDELQRASEKIDMLTTLVTERDAEELRELRRIRDRHSTLEAEHAALQRRFKELETKLGASEKAAVTAKQSLTQAQQRSSDWERRAKEAEGQLEYTKTQLDQIEQSQSQLDADYVMVKTQLEEREADERMIRSRESKLQSEVTALESKVVHLQQELSQARDQIRAAKTPTTAVPAYARYSNGNAVLARPDSRASTVNGGSNGSATPPPARATLWDSMHNPHNPRNSKVPQPKTILSGGHLPVSRNRPASVTQKTTHTPVAPPHIPVAPPSPTPSNVSLAPTVDADGWWS